MGEKKYIRKRRNTEVFIEDAKKVHGNKYDYSKSIYKKMQEKVIIICHEKDPITGEEHGEFLQTPEKHIDRKHGCPKCNGGILISQDEAIRRFRRVHGDKYDYRETIYINNSTPIKVRCQKHNKTFELTPDKHMSGQGCPICLESKLEMEVRTYMEIHGIKYEQHKKFPWLKREKISSQSLDFYLPDYKVAIECQGGQHFFSVDIFGGEEGLKNTQERDKRKKELCEKNNIPLYYFTLKHYKKYDNTAFYNVNALFKAIIT